MTQAGDVVHAYGCDYIVVFDGRQSLLAAEGHKNSSLTSECRDPTRTRQSRQWKRTLRRVAEETGVR